MTVDEKIKQLLYALGLALGALEGMQVLLPAGPDKINLGQLIEKLHGLSEDCL
jgi:hypothetical protein